MSLLDKEAMKPILFNTEMVKAILDGRKMQTRRVIKNISKITDLNLTKILYSNYKVGDILYVRETFTLWGERVLYKADEKTSNEFMKMVGIKWKPSIHMPKKYARIFLKVTKVRVERLRDIQRRGMRAEGCDDEIIDGKTLPEMTPTKWWINLWNSTTPQGYKWEDNPYVFVYEFEKIS